MDDHNSGNVGNGANPQSNGKGKGKETQSETSKGIVERLQESGRMALNAVTTSQDWSGQGSDSKGAAGASRSMEKSPVYSGETSSQRLRTTGPGESIRTTQNSGASAQAFDDFANSESTLQPLPIDHHRPLVQDPSSMVSQQELMDGNDVVQLLNGPSDELSNEVFMPDPKAEDDALTPQAVASLREALFGPTGNQYQPRWDSLLNFTPDFANDPGASFDAQLHMGTADPAEARDIWLGQWNNVLTSYTDEVWGDLGQLVEEALKEVEQLNSTEDIPHRTSETKALDRLRQILGHVRGH